MSASGTAYNDAAGTPVPPPPAYGSNSVADVFESAASLLGQSSLEHPAHPLGNTSRDPLALAQRLREAGADPNGFRNICVVMVDGLGEQLLQTYGSYAPYLKKTVSPPPPPHPSPASAPPARRAPTGSPGTRCVTPPPAPP